MFSCNGSWNCLKLLRSLNPLKLLDSFSTPLKCSFSSQGMSKKCKLDSGISSSVNSSCSTDRSIGNTSLSEGPAGKQFIFLPSPIKSPSDKKDYSVIRLLNGLTALLITDYPTIELPTSVTEHESSDESSGSDTESFSSAGSALEDKSSSNESKHEEKIAACALSVNVGSFSDPEDIPGLAHFLEHMVFMGSAKYPTENEFDSFIKRKGGSDNAHTECEYTTFYFECQEEHLLKALDIFSQFFIAPLMKFEAITRERQAIESEFQMALPSDDYRKEQLLCTAADSDNPVHKFTWGNLITLRDNVEVDHLYNSVHKFRERHYSAHRMTLAIQARLPQEILSDWIVSCFAEVKNNELPPLYFPRLEEPFKKELFNKIYYIEPVKDIFEVKLSWALPPAVTLYKSKPLEYISWIIGHEGQGSLLSYLKSKIWALGITVGEEDDYGSNSLFSIFSIKVKLADEGFEKLDEVIEAVFSYIKLLQTTGPDLRIFNEVKSINDINFRYADDLSAVDNVLSLVENMHIYPPEHYLNGSEIYFTYDPQEIQGYLDCFTPTTVNIMVSSKKLKKDHDLTLTEKWFGTKYKMDDIPTNWISRWSNVKPNQHFQLPGVNSFIPDDFTIFPVEEEKAKLKYPRKIVNDSQMEVWYREDVKFKLPQAYFHFNLILPKLQKTPLHAALSEMYVNLLRQQLIEEAYPALIAQMSYEISTYEKGLTFVISGFNQKLHLLLQKILDGILSFEKNLTREMFSAIKKLLSRSYINANLKATTLAADLRLSSTVKVYWTKLDRLKVLPGITYESLVEFSRSMLDESYMQALIQGNVLEETAINMCKTVTSTLKFQALPLSQIPEIRVCQLNNGEKHLKAYSFNPTDTNCITTVYLQYGPGKIRDFVIVEALQMMLEEPLFDTLRTQEQLGYDVSCSLKDTFGILGFSLSVVSQVDKFTVEHVEDRINNFLQNSLTTLNEMSQEAFEEIITSIVKLKQCSDIDLKEEVKRNWEEIKHGEYVFDRLEKEIDTIKSITMDDVKSFLKLQLGKEKKKLIIQVGGNTEEHLNEVSDTIDYTGSTMNLQLIGDVSGKEENSYVTDLASFKKQLGVFPVTKVQS